MLGSTAATHSASESPNPYAPPHSRVADIARAPGEGLWRDGKTLVMSHDGVFPDRCVRCNRPADGYRLKRTLHWHNPWLLLLFLANALIYVVVAMIAQKKVTITVGLCRKHRRMRRFFLSVNALVFAAAVAALYCGLAMGSSDLRVLGGQLFVAFFFTTLAALLSGAQVVYVKKIDDRHARVGGVKKAFLEQLDELPKEPGKS